MANFSNNGQTNEAVNFYRRLGKSAAKTFEISFRPDDLVTRYFHVSFVRGKKEDISREAIVSKKTQNRKVASCAYRVDGET